ncbi:MAG TPA: recombinase RecT [Phycisphaerae bacterium]|nr:recombinase RecT [Phycisphaerae bacterium]
MTTTEIVQFDRNAALAGPDNCELILHDGQAADMIASSFPGNLDPQRRRDKTLSLIREATIHIANSDARDKICRCTGASVLDCLVSCARLDLSLTKALGHAYLIPFGGVCTLMPGYKGFIKLIVDTGHIRHLETVVVYKNDEFSFYRDEKGPHLRHVPDPESQGDNSQVRLVYLVATTSDGGSMFEMMNDKELEKVRKSSKQPDGPAYKAWPTEMKRKAVIRRFEKSVPKGMDNPAELRLAEALDLDNSQFDPSKLAEYKEMADEHSRSLKERAMAPVVGENAPQSDEQPQPDPTPAAPTLKATKDAWWKLAKAAQKVEPDAWPDLKANAEKWFTVFAASVLGHDIGDLADLDPEDLAAVMADMAENHDARPRDER